MLAKKLTQDQTILKNLNLYQDPAFTSKAPTVQLPNKNPEIAKKQIQFFKQFRINFAYSTENTSINSKGWITVSGILLLSR